MATSGTIATTVVDTSKLLEHAMRRVGKMPADQTPEMVELAKENLFFLLLNLSNRGLNLWAVERCCMGLQSGKALYETAPGTLDLVSVTYTTPTLATTTFAATAEGGEAELATPTAVVRVGFTLGAAFTGVLRISESADGIAYTVASTLATQSYVAGVWYWFDLPAATTNLFFSVDSASAPYPTVTDIRLATALRDLPVTQWNRDTYAAINDKMQLGNPSTSYFFEKKLTPTITLWPVPNNDTDHLTVFRHRQPQDVGSLTNSLEIPMRWYDGIIWLLASRLCFELPGIDPNRVTAVTQMAQQQVFEAELSETDGAPIFLSPGIGVYNR